MKPRDQASPIYKFHNISKECQQLRANCWNTWVCVGGVHVQIARTTGCRESWDSSELHGWRVVSVDLNHTIYFHHSLSSAPTPPPRSSFPPYPLCSIWTWISSVGGAGLMTHGDTLWGSEEGWTRVTCFFLILRFCVVIQLLWCHPLYFRVIYFVYSFDG